MMKNPDNHIFDQTPESMGIWAEKNGIPGAKFTELFNSFSVVGGVKPANGSGRVRAVLTPKPNDEASK